MNQKRLLVIIPAYNEEKNIQNVIESIFKNVKKFSIECLVISDGSNDKTVKIAKNNNCTVIKHLNKRGVGAALRSGFLYAFKNKYELVVNIDGDGQFDSKEIEKLLQAILEKRADFVVGNRFANGRPKNMPHFKYYGNMLMNFFISRITKNKVKDASCGFRAYNKEAIISLNIFNDFTYTQEMFIDAKFKNLRISQVPISVTYFNDRVSKVANNLFEYTYRTLKIIIRTFAYYKPLKFFGTIGFMSALVGLGFVVYLFFIKLSTGAYTPYKAFGFIGASMIFLGVFLGAIGLFADTFSKTRKIQEEILYYEKLRRYEE